MTTNISEIAKRIKSLRILMEISVEEMAKATGVEVAEYKKLEEGNTDFSFTFLYKCSEKFGIDIVELMTGDTPKLKSYSITRAGEGLPLNRREGFAYRHLAHLFKNKSAEPFLVTAPFKAEEQNAPIHLSEHEGQEMDYVLRGKLKIQIGAHSETLNEGDCIFYDSATPHGMIAINNNPCEFMAIVFKKK